MEYFVNGQPNNLMHVFIFVLYVVGNCVPNEVVDLLSVEFIKNTVRAS